MNACGCKIKRLTGQEGLGQFGLGEYIQYCNLHACAPELLEKLKLFDLGKFHEGNKVQWEFPLDIYDSIRQLIARAEGRTK